MTIEEDLRAVVDARFAAAGPAPWPDPHWDQGPAEEEYSRVTDPARWRILGARADAWAEALVDAGFAAFERDATVTWNEPPGTRVSRTDRVTPHTAGALPLVLARSRIENVADAGLTLGVGDPAVCVTHLPACGCDACDSGSESELDQLDDHILSIVTGAFRRFSVPGKILTVLGDSGWSASGLFSGEVDAVLADPTGWVEHSGVTWTSVGPRT